jgi:hypothetical protein
MKSTQYIIPLKNKIAFITGFELKILKTLVIFGKINI